MNPRNIHFLVIALSAAAYGCTPTKTTPTADGSVTYGTTDWAKVIATETKTTNFYPATEEPKRSWKSDYPATRNVDITILSPTAIEVFATTDNARETVISLGKTPIVQTVELPQIALTFSIEAPRNSDGNVTYTFEKESTLTEDATTYSNKVIETDISKLMQAEFSTLPKAAKIHIIKSIGLFRAAIYAPKYLVQTKVAEAQTEISLAKIEAPSLKYSTIDTEMLGLIFKLKRASISGYLPDNTMEAYLRLDRATK